MLIKKNCIPGYIWIIPLYQPSQAPSTSIRIFLNPQLFLSGFKNVHVHTYRIQIETYPKRIWIHFSTQDSSGNIGNRACVVKRAKFASCFALREPGNEVAILNTVYSSPDKKKIRIQCPHDSGFIAYSKICTLESGFKKFHILIPNSPDKRYCQLI